MARHGLMLICTTTLYTTLRNVAKNLADIVILTLMTYQSFRRQEGARLQYDTVTVPDQYMRFPLQCSQHTEVPFYRL